MTKASNTTVYPFDYEFLPILRHMYMIPMYSFMHLVSPNGWGFTNKDAGKIDGGKELGIIVENDFDKAINDSETVIFASSSKKIDFEQYIYPKMIDTAKKGKNIISMIYINDKIKEELSNICIENNSVFKQYYNNDKFKYINNIVNETIYTINVPVIFVLGISERTNKFDIQLSLRENICNKGYKISQVGSRQCCELFGFHSFPRFMFSKDLYEFEKIILFNHYIKNIEKKENPDVILIGIPGSTMPINKRFTNKFGVTAYEISQAVLPDACVFSTLYDTYTSDYYSMLSKTTQYRFGFDIDCFNMSTTAFDWRSLNRDSDIASYVNIDWNHVIRNIKDINKNTLPIYNVQDNKNALEMADFLLSKLKGYSEVQAI